MELQNLQIECRDLKMAGAPEIFRKLPNHHSHIRTCLHGRGMIELRVRKFSWLCANSLPVSAFRYCTAERSLMSCASSVGQLHAELAWEAAPEATPAAAGTTIISSHHGGAVQHRIVQLPRSATA